MKGVGNKATVKVKYKKMMAGLRSSVECPVCIAVPTDGHMLSCPRGHLVCNTCRLKMRAEPRSMGRGV